MSRIKYLLPILCAGIALSVTGGCGQYSTNDTAHSAPASTPASSSTPAHATSHGSVSVHINAPSYQAHEHIIVTISNQSSTSIVFPDHLTNCTVILLQRQGNGTWENINPCKLMIATRLHTLKPKQQLAVTLQSTVGWAPGLYRASLSYFLAQQATQPVTIYSASAQVAGR